MKKKCKIYKNILIDGLKELSDIYYQKRIWLNLDNPDNLVTSFVEAANNVFDDALISYALSSKQIIFDRKVTRALQDLDEAVDAVNEFRSTEEIINDPLMQVVREKAAIALELIEASDGREGTVEIVEYPEGSF